MTGQWPPPDEAAFVLRTVDERLSQALSELADADVVRAVHEVRKRLKSARALLWALEQLPYGISRKAARRARIRLGRAAALLAGARDAEVLAETAASNGFGGVARRLRAAVPQADALPLERAGRKIAAVRAALGAIRADDGGPLLRAAILRSYREGRRGWRSCRTDRSAKALHGWRKRVKRLYYLLSALPEHDPVAADQLNRLGDLLGLDHDNALLADRVGDVAGNARRKRAKIATTRKRLQRQIFDLAATVYAPKPTTFAAATRWPAGAC